ncbi:MAG: division/cell wall cluster transcriptional repressor MraZ [Solirubrobacterales bacterium]|nr:division/cell wall cluster transcriptional repressor MraZ [Solirubrobacterales bacterium]HRV59728.1 division/cell wall cluster transcriptional repressor MraZ [Solirubrobacterales bacterium]
MAFRGQHEHSLDSKDRLTVPRKFRAALDDGYVLAKGPDACLWLYATKDFDAMEERYVAPHSPFGADARNLRRMLNASADEGELDAAGRIRIPDDLKKLTGIDGACAVVGAGDYIEIWNAEAWAKLNEDLLGQFADVAENLSGGSE